MSPVKKNFLSLERSSSHPPSPSPPSILPPYVSYVMCHVSYVTCHMSHFLNFFKLNFFLPGGGFFLYIYFFLVELRIFFGGGVKKTSPVKGKVFFTGDRHTHTRTSQLYDWIGPVGRFSENLPPFVWNWVKCVCRCRYRAVLNVQMLIKRMKKHCKEDWSIKEKSKFCLRIRFIWAAAFKGRLMDGDRDWDHWHLRASLCFLL